MVSIASYDSLEYRRMHEGPIDEYAVPFFRRSRPQQVYRHRDLSHWFKLGLVGYIR